MNNFATSYFANNGSKNIQYHTCKTSVYGCVSGKAGKFVQSQNMAYLGRYLATDDDGQERTRTDARGAVFALAELRQNKTTPLFSYERPFVKLYLQKNRKILR